MTRNTVQPLLAFESVQGLRDDLLELADMRREARSLLRRVKQDKMEPEERSAASERSGRLWIDAGVMESRIRARLRKRGVLDEFCSLCLSEARRLPEIIPGLMYRDQWREYYLLRTAGKVAWDAGSTEFDAALEVARESEPWKALQKARDKIRTARRLKDGYWQREDRKAEDRRRKAEKRQAMTEEQRKEASRLRSERRRQAKLKKAKYASMLDEPEQSKEAA